MRLAEIARTIREACEVLAQPKPTRFVIHLEKQIDELHEEKWDLIAHYQEEKKQLIADHQTEKLRLEGKCDMLQLKLDNALAPKPIPVPVKRDIPKVVPPISSWELYKQSEMAKQELEEAESKQEVHA